MFQFAFEAALFTFSVNAPDKAAALLELQLHPTSHGTKTSATAPRNSLS